MDLNEMMDEPETIKIKVKRPPNNMETKLVEEMLMMMEEGGSKVAEKIRKSGMIDEMTAKQEEAIVEDFMKMIESQGGMMTEKGKKSVGVKPPAKKSEKAMKEPKYLALGEESLNPTLAVRIDYMRNDTFLYDYMKMINWNYNLPSDDVREITKYLRYDATDEYLERFLSVNSSVGKIENFHFIGLHFNHQENDKVIRRAFNKTKSRFGADVDFNEEVKYVNVPKDEEKQYEPKELVNKITEDEKQAKEKAEREAYASAFGGMIRAMRGVGGGTADDASSAKGEAQNVKDFMKMIEKRGQKVTEKTKAQLVDDRYNEKRRQQKIEDARIAETAKEDAKRQYTEDLKKSIYRLRRDTSQDLREALKQGYKPNNEEKFLKDHADEWLRAEAVSKEDNLFVRSPENNLKFVKDTVKFLRRVAIEKGEKPYYWDDRGRGDIWVVKLENAKVPADYKYQFGRYDLNA